MSDYRNVPVYKGPVKACIFDWAGEYFLLFCAHKKVLLMEPFKGPLLPMWTLYKAITVVF